MKPSRAAADRLVHHKAGPRSFQMSFRVLVVKAFWYQEQRGGINLNERSEIKWTVIWCSVLLHLICWSEFIPSAASLLHTEEPSVSHRSSLFSFLSSSDEFVQNQLG